MDIESGHRYSQSSALNIPHHYYVSERNAPLTISNRTRHDPRGYPMGGPVGGPRMRGSINRSDDNEEDGPARRRIAVACARCRKRKIRCSGDADGSGCTSCKQAGADLSECRFHRVGSDTAKSILNRMSFNSSVPNMANPNAMIQIYHHSTPLYPRTMSSQYPQMDAKAVYHPAWPFPYHDEASAVETYNLDRPTAYLSDQATMAAASMYGGDYRWSQTDSKPIHGGSNEYMDRDPGSVIATHELPYDQTTLRATATTEALSPLNLNSFQLALPERPHPQQMPTSDPAMPQRQLPVPQPSPAQSSRNVVDQLQDQRLRSARSSLTNGATFARPALPQNGNSDVQVTAPTEASTGGLTTQVATPVPISNSPEAAMSYLPVTTSVSEQLAVATQPQLNFSTSSLLNGMPAPSIPTTYSNFRNYSLPTSSPTQTLSPLARQDSLTNLYSFTPDVSSKRNSISNASNDSALVSGHRYTPLSHTPSYSHQQTCLSDTQRDSFGTRPIPAQRASMSNLNSSF